VTFTATYKKYIKFLLLATCHCDKFVSQYAHVIKIIVMGIFLDSSSCVDGTSPALEFISFYSIFLFVNQVATLKPCFSIAIATALRNAYDTFERECVSTFGLLFTTSFDLLGMVVYSSICSRITKQF
jgi:hypothetical protein